MTEATTPSRRIGAEDSRTRARLLDAAHRLLLDEGYAAVTSRRVAARAGLKPQLVHYYFRTMDDLFLALFRRAAERNLARLERVLTEPDPLRALWRFGSDRAGTAFLQEYAALANHRKAIRAEIAAHADRFRRRQIEVIAEVLAEAGVDTEAVPPAAVAVLLTAAGQVLGMEAALGLTTGHDEAVALVERLLDRVGPTGD
ncbi:MAG TPA: helix-turn-helix domain-containing protein [Acidimicrobiales bacterium]